MNTWYKAIAQPATEFEQTTLRLLEGEIPAQLQGTLYRNGPARLAIGKQKVGHWFDGDGAILGVNFAGQMATATYKYVQTQGYLAELQAQKYLFANYGMTAAGAFWNNIFKPVKNSANTSVLALEDRLLALWEGGSPHGLDLETLATKGADNLADTLDKLPFSAHPKIDPVTGEIFNFGVNPGSKNTLYLYRCDASGKIIRQGSFNLSGLPIIHDFVLAGDYLVFFISPIRTNTLSLLLGRKSYSDAMKWQPKLGTQILIFDRDDLSLVSQNRTDPWYQWHYSNGYLNRDRQIVIEFIRYPNFQTNEFLREVATGEIKTKAKGTLWQVIVNPKTAKVMENKQLLDRQCEFPTVAPAKVGQSWRYTYLNTHLDNQDRGQELFTAIARFDRQTGDLAVSQMGENFYPAEPLFVPRTNENDSGWIITVVFNGNLDRSEVWIYQSDRLAEKPVCRLVLPSVIPHSFHGTWKAA